VTESTNPTEDQTNAIEGAAARRSSSPQGAGLAGVALVFGLLGLFGPFFLIIYWPSSLQFYPYNLLLAGPVGLSCAVIALIVTRSRPELRKVRRRAWGGLFTSLLALGWPWLIVVSHNAAYGWWGGVRQINLRGQVAHLHKTIQKYADRHEGKAPPDLDTAAEFTADPGGLLIRYLGDTGNTTTDFHYVVGLDADAPANWIRVYGDSGLFGDEGGAILCVDGTVELLDEPEFGVRLKQFMDDYRTKRGEPPTIIAPH